MDKQTIEKLRNEIAEAETPEKVKEVCEKYGIDKMPEEESKKLIFGTEATGELSDDELDKVSGGLRDRWGHLLVDGNYVCDNFKCEGVCLDESSGKSLSPDGFYKYVKNCNSCGHHDCKHCSYSNWTGFLYFFQCKR